MLPLNKNFDATMYKRKQQKIMFFYKSMCPVKKVYLIAKEIDFLNVLLIVEIK